MSAFAQMSDVQFAEHLTTELKVAAIPLTPFYGHAPEQKIVRFCFAKKQETLNAAVDNLKQGLSA